MPRDKLPPDVQRLLDERSSARQASNWSRADALRAELAAAGWEPQDGPSGSTARPILADASPDESVSLLDEAAEVDASVQVVADDHPGDLARFLGAVGTHVPGLAWELVLVADAPSFDVDPIVEAAGLPLEPVVLRADGRLGWGGSRTLGMRRSRGRVTILVDTSLEPVGDFVTPLVAAFDDERVGIAGGWGVTSGDGREFVEAPPGEVDAVEGYCLAVRREALRAVGGVDHRFRFYRNADLDLSFAVRDAGWSAVRTGPLPVVRHEHRGWTSLPDDERDRLSKRNFYRFLDRWGDRRDLLLHPEPDDR
ncbi:MAG TPA: glycosyltransferase [Candidatus Limnocylindria bacterium]